MATFYKCINNGTIAIVSETTRSEIKDWGKLDEAERVARPYPTPIFTFVRDDGWYEKCYRHLVTGTTDLMDVLLRGHKVLEGFSFYVPFSNSIELQGGEAAEQELRFRTTLAEAMRAFELMPTLGIRAAILDHQ